VNVAQVLALCVTAVACVLGVFAVFAYLIVRLQD
jgi:hypothetical protein